MNKIKSKRAIMTFILFLSISIVSLTMPVQALQTAKSIGIITPNYVDVCSVHGAYHIPLRYRISPIKWAYGKITSANDTVYLGSYYECQCGSVIYWCNDGSTYNEYWYGGSWYSWGISGLPGAFDYMVPNGVYLTSATTPPKWQIQMAY